MESYDQATVASAYHYASYYVLASLVKRILANNALVLSFFSPTRWKYVSNAAINSLIDSSSCSPSKHSGADSFIPSGIKPTGWREGVAALIYASS